METDAHPMIDDPRRRSRRPWLWFAGLALLFGAALFLQSARRSSAKSLPILGRVTDFLLTERSGKPITRKSLEGRIWIADFIFTSCAGTCPIMTARMHKLSDELAQKPLGEVALVSISVDPARDTPQVLRQYADKNHAPQDRWLFLTGDQTEIDRLAVQSFKIGADYPTQEEILHSDLFFLVDGEGRIRGSYHALTELESNDLAKVPADVGMPDAEKKRLLTDIEALQKEAAGAARAPGRSL